MTLPIDVPGVGPPTARIAIVGEAPGADEERQRQPFVGAAGQLLNTLLTKVGINRSDIYITNLVKVRPPDNKMERLHERGVTIQQYLPELERELRTVNPHIIITMGAHSTEHVAGVKPITKWRGSLLPCALYSGGPKVLPTIHPAAVLRDYSMHPVVLMDLTRAKQQSRSRELPTDTAHFVTEPTLDQVAEYIDYCLQTKEFSYDIETWMGRQIRCIGLSADESSAICIPLKKGILNYWTADNEAQLWTLLQRLFASSCWKVAQNIGFDLSFLTPHCDFPLAPLFDTLTAHHLLAPELPHDLAFLTSIYTLMPFYKLASVERATDADTWVYNCRDAVATLRVSHRLREEIDHRGLHDFYCGYVMPLFRVLFDMQQRGVHINLEERLKLIAQLNNEKFTLSRELEALVGAVWNEKFPNSNKQLKAFFYESGRFKPIISLKSGNPTVDEEALVKLSDQGSKEAPIILGIRERQKKVSVLSVETSPQGNLHTEYVISGTDTGRLSSRTPISGYGTNLQNIDKALRGIFVPQEGNVFVKGDLVQAENMVVAWLARGQMKEAFLRGDDVHQLTADLIHSERRVGKVMNHMSNYGGGPVKLASILGCAVKEAREKQELYHRAYPEVRGVFQRQVVEQLQRNRTLTTPLGRIRQFLGRWSDDTFRRAYAFVPQSTVGDYLNMGLLRLWHALAERHLEAHCVLQVHDEIVVECLPELADTVAQLMHQCVEVPIVVGGDMLTIPMEVKTLHRNWLK